MTPIYLQSSHYTSITLHIRPEPTRLRLNIHLEILAETIGSKPADKMTNTHIAHDV